MTITWQTLITAAAVLAAAIAIWKYFATAVRFIDRQKAQDEEIKKLRQQHEDDMRKLEARHDADIQAIKEENTLLVYADLACLKGLNEIKSSDAVEDAIDKLTKHINKRAHE